MPRKRYHMVVHGRVQGVAFREYTRREAVRLNLAGWVRNLPAGTVEALFEGDASSVEALLQWLRTGSPTPRSPVWTHAKSNQPVI